MFLSKPSNHWGSTLTAAPRPHAKPPGARARACCEIKPPKFQKTPDALTHRHAKPRLLCRYPGLKGVVNWTEFDILDKLKGAPLWDRSKSLASAVHLQAVQQQQSG